MCYMESGTHGLHVNEGTVSAWCDMHSHMQVVSATTKKRLLIKALQGLKQSKDGIQVTQQASFRGVHAA